MADLTAVGSPSTPQSISTKSRFVRQALVDLRTLLDEKQQYGKPLIVPLASVMDVTERFALWTGSLGALHLPKSKLSLDSRLSDAADIRNYIDGQLDEMIDAITSR